MLADGIVVVHLGYVLFVMLGGLLAMRWPWVIWLHVPAVLWGVVIEYSGGICPLTPLENSLRQRTGSSGYEGEFIGHYILPLLYPAGLTRRSQMALGTLALAFNAAIYVLILRKRRRAVFRS
jgi:hypothetical protein